MNTGIAVARETWRELYKVALFEADKGKLSERIADAEAALVLRARELFHADGDHIEEEEALDDAMYALHALRNTVELFRRDGLELMTDDGPQVAA